MTEKNKLLVSPDKIVSNYRLIKNNYHSEYPFYAVVKSNAYGHGLKRVVQALYSAGHRHFAVFHLKEALRLRKLFSDIRILVMGDTPFQYLEEVKSNEIEIGIFSRYKWKELLDKGLSDTHLHIKIETGMNRMGIKNIRDDRFHDLIRKSQKNNCTISFYTHLSAAPQGIETARVENQYKVFNEHISYLISKVKNIRHIHFFNSANLPYHAHKEQHQSYGARIGLLLYGYSPLRDNSPFPWIQELQPAMELHSWIMQVKTVKKGEYLGYGLKYQCKSNKRLGFVPIGYADGLSRSLTNAGKVLTEYGITSILGAVNMNLIAIDLTEFSKVKTGDRVTILGSNEYGILTAADHAQAAGTIEYEILTSIGNQEIWENYG